MLRARFSSHEPGPQDAAIFPFRVTQQSFIPMQFRPPFHDVRQHLSTEQRRPAHRRRRERSFLEIINLEKLKKVI